MPRPYSDNWHLQAQPGRPAVVPGAPAAWDGRGRPDSGEWVVPAQPGRPAVVPGLPDFMPGAPVTNINNLIERTILPSLINNNKALLSHIRVKNDGVIDELILIKSIVMAIIIENDVIGESLTIIIDKVIKKLYPTNQFIVAKIKEADKEKEKEAIRVFLQHHLIEIRNLLIKNNDISGGGKSRNKRDNKRIRSKTNRRKTIRRRKNKNIRHKSIRRKER